VGDEGAAESLSDRDHSRVAFRVIPEKRPFLVRGGAHRYLCAARNINAPRAVDCSRTESVPSPTTLAAPRFRGAARSPAAALRFQLKGATPSKLFAVGRLNRPPLVRPPRPISANVPQA